MAGAVIGALRANLTLNSAQFESGAKRARSLMDRMGVSMAGLARAAAALGAAMGALGAVAIQNSQEILRYSRMLKVAPEEFQKWSAAAARAGIEQEALGDILKDFQEKVGEYLTTGAGGMTDFFEKIAPKVGATAEEFAKLSGPEAMQLYVSYLQKAGVGQKQMTFFMESMASESTRLLPLLMNNAAGLKEIGQSAENTGRIISEQTLLNLESFKLAVDGVKLSFHGFAANIGGILTPMFTSLANALADSMGPGGALDRVFTSLASNLQRMATYAATAAAGFVLFKGALVVAAVATAGLSTWLGFLRVAILRTGIGALIIGAGELTYRFIQLKEAGFETGEAFKMLGRVALGAINSIFNGIVWLADNIRRAMQAAIGSVIAAFQSLPPVLGAIGKMAGAELINGMASVLSTADRVAGGFIDKIGGKIEGWTGFEYAPRDRGIKPIDTSKFRAEAEAAMRAAGASVSEAFQDGINGPGVEFGKLLDGVGTFSEEFGKLRKATESVKEEGDKAASTIDTLHDELLLLGEDAPASGGGKGGATAAKEAAAGVKELSEEAQAAQSAVGILRDGMANAFSQMVTGAKSAREAVGELLKSLASMIANNAFQQLFNGVLGNGTTTTGGVSGIGKIASFLFGGIPGFAKGTSSAPGGLAWVGEEGPELVNLPRGSQVFDATRSAVMANGGGRLSIVLSPGLMAEMLDKAAAQSVDIVEEGLNIFSRDALPSRQNAIAGDPRRRG